MAYVTITLELDDGSRFTAERDSARPVSTGPDAVLLVQEAFVAIMGSQGIDVRGTLAQADASADAPAAPAAEPAAEPAGKAPTGTKGGA